MDKSWILVISLLTSSFSFAGDTEEAAAVKTKAVDVEVGVRVFLRPELQINPAYQSSAETATGRVRQGIRISGTATRGELKVVGQLQDVRNWGTESSNLSMDPLAGLHQGYLQVGKERKEGAYQWLRFGRQEWRLGNGRFLGEAPWQPAGQAFDGLRAHFKRDKAHADVFLAMRDTPETVTRVTEDDSETVYSHGGWFGVLTATAMVHDAITPTVSVYSLFEGPTSTDPERDRVLVAPAVRLMGSPVAGLSYDIDVMVQTGHTGDRDHMAYMAGGRLSYALPDVVGAPKITAIYEQSSGEKCGGAPEDTTGCAGDDSRAFFPFFGRNHFYRGVGDQVGGINARDIGAGLSAKPVKQLALSATWHHFQLVEPEGAWYRNNGAIVGWEPGNSEAALGHEIDLLATYKPIKQVFLQGAVIWFKPVGVGERLAGPGSTLSSYLWLVVSL